MRPFSTADSEGGQLICYSCIVLHSIAIGKFKRHPSQRLTLDSHSTSEGIQGSLREWIRNPAKIPSTKLRLRLFCGGGSVCGVRHTCAFNSSCLLCLFGEGNYNGKTHSALFMYPSNKTLGLHLSLDVLTT